jgi:hypothetical protein
MRWNKVEGRRKRKVDGNTNTHVGFTSFHIGIPIDIHPSSILSLRTLLIVFDDDLDLGPDNTV